MKGEVMNEKRKLELRDFAGYLPYGLCGKNPRKPSYQFVEFEKVPINENLMFYLDERHGCRIILRPLSDLHERIIHNGKEIIPIVELAKIYSRNYPHPHNPEPVDWKFNPCSSEGDQCATGDCEGMENFMFTMTGGDDDDGWGFYVQMEEDATFRAVNNQRLLWDYLDELKIDYRNLIDDGLAVSVHDIKGTVYG